MHERLVYPTLIIMLMRFLPIELKSCSLARLKASSTSFTVSSRTSGSTVRFSGAVSTAIKAIELSIPSSVDDSTP